ncbi:hypothetical protein BU26DRAFT_47158 [Trematosphaeria pertusa]|uniref:Heterokaryon incompatibility domain-containing protein n=1 Tax=Trematosphaeria pertusa TaxID=390896 RepID=A0A6A6I975_9PLEO|nr:uncharacterized protein BU26DRAFT_47158 [Trematosphaeria pertusa]KAF2246492.1 hypothetical protein BU26DRAFT_47158 [Trematosphaeria pertusa]
MAYDSDASDLQNTTRSFRWRDVPGSWPRRLLHVPTMTSLERQEDNVYGDAKEPRYGILTYTWGRYPGTNETRIGISGTTWSIPVVSATHFSAASLERVIKRIGEDVDFAWVDIACIDQEDEAIKMDEVRNQVAIFANAHRVYVWLSRITTESLRGILNDIFLCETHLQSQDEQALGKSVLKALSDLNEYLSILLKDPWFSSLWTLQEGTLRSDALILSREGYPIPLLHEPSLNVYYGFLLNAFWHLTSASGWILMYGTPEVGPMADTVLNQIRLAGYDHAPFARNPNIQYGAARRRETTRPLDRIYGIMAIYGVRVGAKANTEYTFEGLEQEFAATLNNRSPRLGQMFIHTAKPAPGCTWKITQRCRVTDELGTFKSSGQDSCTISASSSIGSAYNGPTCQLHSLLGIWHARMAPSPGENDRFYWCQIRLDDYVCDDYPNLPRIHDVPFDMSMEARDRFLPLGSALLKVFGDDSIIILKLGEQPVENSFMAAIGLVLLRIDGAGPGYQRLGICQWALGRPNGVQDPKWEHQCGIIY